MITKDETLGLLRQMAKGDQSAASKFYIAYRPALENFLNYKRRNFGVGVTGNKAPNDGITDDTIQEVMLEVWNHPERFDPGQGARFTTWLFTIAQRRFIDQLRKRRMRTVEFRDELGGEEDDGGYDALVSDELVDETSDKWDGETSGDGYEALNTLDRKSAVRHCKEKLKGRERQLITLAYEHEMPGREIAQVMDMAEGTVKSALHAARGSIKKCLEKYLKGALV